MLILALCSGEAVFTRQYSHPVRGTYGGGGAGGEYDDLQINLQRTPTDAEINALWNKVTVSMVTELSPRKLKC